MFEELRTQYANAPYSFFRVRNYLEAMASFLADPKNRQPQFTYSPRLSEHQLARRSDELAEAALLAGRLNDAALQTFLDKRLSETELLRSFLALQADPKSTELLEAYRSRNLELYGDFDPELFGGVVGYLRERARQQGMEQAFESLAAMLGDYPKTNLFKPSNETFHHYRSYVKDGVHPIGLLIDKPLAGSPDSAEVIEALFVWALASIGADKHGWRLQKSEQGTNVMLSRHRRLVIIGKHYRPRTEARLKQVVAHEVFVHVWRSLTADSHTASDTEEGMALVAEQLIAPRFMYRRMLRYFAAALAWGVDGKPRTFNETFAIMCLACKIVTGLTHEEALEQSFRECTRIFRGGVPSVPGAVYSKDKVYLETNLAIWHELENNVLHKDAFLALLNGAE